MSRIESVVNDALNKTPKVKKIIKRLYQLGMYTISHKIKSEGDIIRISPDDGMEYFFGYYDKSPWDATDRYMLCLRVKNTYLSVAPKEPAEIILFDTQDNNSYKVLAKTNTWNIQQGCMLQWLGPDYSERIIYNDFRDGCYRSVILNINTSEEKVISMPIYSVSQDGKFALTLDFSRLHRLRKGYGYSNIPESTKDKKCPDKPCIWHINLESTEVKVLMKYTDFARFEPRHEMKDAEHKVNHIMLNPSGERFMVLHRWFNGSRKYTRLVTVNSDGTVMYNLSDDDMISHCCWKNDIEVLAYARKKNAGNGYYLMKDNTQVYEKLWQELSSDGHPSYSPDGSLIVTDTYPDRARIATVYCMNGDKINKSARVFAPFKYDNDVRCDLHPRWNRAGDKVCFDSAFEGHRGLYIVSVRDVMKDLQMNFVAKEDTHIIEGENVNEVQSDAIKYSIVVPVYNSFDLMGHFFDSLNNQTYKNFELVLVDDGSSDGSYEKLLQYKAKSKLNMVVLKTVKNSGPGCARNIGMDVAKGEFITFLDNDDWVEYSFLEEINGIIKQSNVHCVIYDLYSQTSKEKTIISSMYKGEEGICKLEDCLKFARNHSVGKFYKLEDCRRKNVRFPELRRCEDVGFSARAIEACATAYYYKKPLYYYYQRSSSLSNNSKLDATDMVKAFSVIEEYLGDKYPEAVMNKSVTDLLYGGVLMMCKCQKSSKEIKEFIRKYELRYPNWYEVEIRNYLGKSKKLFLYAVKKKSMIMLRLMTLVHSLLLR